MSINLNPFQLLEINLISAQDLAAVSRSMRTYAVAWVHPDRKLSTRVDTHGHANPTWNDKFVFRVDDDFLRSDTSAIMIEIYALSYWFRDVHVGTVRVLVGNLIPPPSRPNHHHHQPRLGMRFVALQVRRPSGRPQGILNIGIALLDSSMRSMPLYSHLSASAVGFHDLMMGDDKEDHHHHNHLHQGYHHQTNVIVAGNMDHQPHAKAQQLRRSRSERSERVTDVEFHQKPGSVIDGPDDVRGKEDLAPQKGKKGKKKKASSLTSGSEVKKVKSAKASSLVNGSEVIRISNINGFDLLVDPLNLKENKPRKAGSIINGSDVGTTPKLNAKDAGEPESGPLFLPSKSTGIHMGGLAGKGRGRAQGKVEFAARPRKSYEHGQYWADSEVGPSASEVAEAAAVAMEGEEEEDKASGVDEWSLDESVEGLRSKLERWRTELPPLYDRGGEYESLPPSTISVRSSRGNGRHVRRHTDGSGPGLFSCFGNVCGYECSCVCGRNTTVLQKKGGSERQLLTAAPIPDP